MVEATAMVYKVMEEQHKMDSFVPKEPAILKDEMRLNEFALQLCRTHGGKTLLSHRKRRKTQQEGLTNKHHEKMAMQEEHIMDIALNGENYCSAIHR
jgi:hypothetical protein